MLPAMSAWKWLTGPVDFALKCAGCTKQARLEPLLVQWTDGNAYHAGCLLDKLSATAVPEKAADPTTDYALSWGGMGGLP